MSKKYLSFYLITFLLLITLVIAKQKVIIRKNQKKVISYYSSWKNDGKRVVVQKPVITDTDDILKTTLIYDSDNIYIGYVTKSYLRFININSSISIFFDDKKMPAKIIEISDKIDKETGMYCIKVYCDSSPIQKNNKYFAEIHLPSAKNVVILPFDSINTENNFSYVWVIDDGKVQKKFVTLEHQTSTGFTVKGIDKNDLIVIEGSSNIKENDKVKISYGN